MTHGLRFIYSGPPSSSSSSTIQQFSTTTMNFIINKMIIIISHKLSDVFYTLLSLNAGLNVFVVGRSIDCMLWSGRSVFFFLHLQMIINVASTYCLCGMYFFVERFLGWVFVKISIHPASMSCFI